MDDYNRYVDELVKEYILRFIYRFTQYGKNSGVINSFTNGCCYWFARILSERFVSDEIVYDQVANHFGCRIGNEVYDITGDVTDKYNWESWEVVAKEDNLRTSRIVRDCINF